MNQPQAWRDIARKDVLDALDAIGPWTCEDQDTLAGMPEPIQAPEPIKRAAGQPQASLFD